ncbi:MAG: ABC transporter substrate-binding protein [Chloroflexota bacterium]|nr:ABC transporter substrate-binding protein [Chloroflexota bacterium]
MDEALKHLSRRHFLSGAAVAAGTAILAACGGSSAATDTPKAGSTTSGATTAPSAATTAPAAASTSAAPAATTSAAGSAAAKPAGTTAAGSAPAGAPVAGAIGTGKVKSQILTTGIKKGGTLIEGGASDVRTFNPVLQGDTTSGLINGLLYDRLVDIDPDTLQPIPNLATKWDIAPDSKTYTFTLKQGVKWHDGQPFTADDVKFSYDSYMNPDTGSQRAGTLNQDIASVTVTDPQTVVFTLKGVVAPFLVNDANYSLVAKHIFGSVAPKDFRTNEYSTTKPVGTGPFKFKEYQQGDHVTLVGNPEYHRGATALDTYIYKVSKDSTSLYQSMKTGEVDYGTLSPELYDDATKQANLNIATYDTFSFTYFGYNLDPTKTTLFQDVKVRQALFYAVDRASIVKKLFNGLGVVAIGTEPVLSWAYQPDKITTKYEYDPKKAAQMLDDAGWKAGADGIRAKDGKRLSFSMWTNSGNKTRENYLLVLQESWKAIGVEMKPQFEEFSVYLDRINKNFDFEMFLVGFSWGVDPDQTTMWDSGQHGGGFNSYDYKSDKVDGLLKQGLQTLDQEKRKQAYVDMQNQVLTDAPAMVSDFPKGIIGVNKRVMNRIPNGVAGSDRNYANLWYVTDGK